MHRRDVTLRVGDDVLLNYKTSQPEDASVWDAQAHITQYIGPFEMLERIEAFAYRLRLPATMNCLHDVFHVSLLPYHRIKYRQYTTAPASTDRN